MQNVLIVYSTIGGNTELAVDRVIEDLVQAEIPVTRQRVDVTKATEILAYDLVILASPTYGQGTIEDHFKPFLSDLKKIDCNGRKFAVIGLGDTKYYPEYLTEAAGILEEEIKKMGGLTILPPLRIGMPPLKFINKLVPSWTNKIIDILKAE